MKIIPSDLILFCSQGTVAISFTYAATSLVFLCSHFPAGQKEVQERNNDYSEAIKRIAFPNVRTACRIPCKVTDAFLFRGEQFFRMTLCFGVETLTTGSIWAEMK